MSQQEQVRWADGFSERFHLFAHGEAFDIDAFLATTTLHPDHVWRRVRPQTSGVEFVLGEGPAVPFQKQEDIAISFIKAHRDELRALAQFPGVDTFILGFRYVCKRNDSSLGFCIGPSSRLMWHALDIGFRPNYYVWFDPSEMQNADSRNP